MNKIIFYIVSVGAILFFALSVWPYVNKSLIKAELKNAALYGTKHTIDDTYQFVSKELSKKKILFNDSDGLNILKDDNNNVSIQLNYQDRITFFGIVLKELDFELDVTEQDTKEFI